MMKNAEGFNLELEKQPVNTERTKVMFELPICKHDYYGTYVEETIVFLRSLGFDVESKQAGSPYLVINGYPVSGNFDFASTMGRGAFTKQWRERASRRVDLTWLYKSGKICSIPVNKEIDKLKLVNKILLAFKKRDDFDAEIAKAEKDKISLITSLYEKYKNVTGFKSIIIVNGILRIGTISGSLVLTADGIVTTFAINLPDFKSLDDLNDFPDNALRIKNDIFKAKEEIEALGATGVTSATKNASAYVNEAGELKTN